MKAVLTCFQPSESFGPLTRFRPVALLPLLNMSLLRHYVELCVSNGLKEIHIAVVEHPFVVRSFVGDGARWGAEIKVWTFKDSCSARETMIRLADKLDGPAVLFPVEQLLDISIQDLIAFHNSHNRGCTRIFCSNRLEPTTDFDDSSTPIVSHELQAARDSGILITDGPDVPDDTCEVMNFERFWMPIDSPRTLWAANMACLDDRFPVFAGGLHFRREDKVWYGHHTVIGPSCTITGPAMIGDYTAVKSEARIGPYCAIGEGSIVDAGAHVNSSLVFDHTYLGSQTSVENSIAADNNVLNMKIGSWVTVTDPFLISNIQEKIFIPWTVQLFNKGIAGVLLCITSPVWLVKGLLRRVRGRHFFDTELVIEFDSRIGAESLARGITFNRLVFSDSKGLTSRMPGLIDVLRGRLALVGVRPLEKIDELTYAEDWAKQRFDAPAGLFTPVDAEAMNEALEEEKVIAENIYVAKRSFREDLKVLVGAIRNLLFSRK